MCEIVCCACLYNMQMACVYVDLQIMHIVYVHLYVDKYGLYS